MVNDLEILSFIIYNPSVPFFPGTAVVFGKPAESKLYSQGGDVRSSSWKRNSQSSAHSIDQPTIFYSIYIGQSFYKVVLSSPYR